MKLTGGCYCEALRFEIDGDANMRALCLCITCQRISGGAGNLFVGIMADAFRYVQGAPRVFARPDRADAPAREFCGTCGTHIASRTPKAPGGLIVKVGTLDDPGAFGGPQAVYWAEERQTFHHLPPGVPVFSRLPGR